LIGETESNVMSTAGLFAGALLTASLLVCLVQPHEAPIKRALAHPQLVYLGKISYGVYLWHFPIMKLLQTSGRDWEFVLIVGSCLSVTAAAVSYRFVERPFLELKKHFEFRPPVETAPPQPIRRSA
jgi:Predicted acyltransferases